MSPDPWPNPARRRRLPVIVVVSASALALAVLAFAWSAYETRTQLRELSLLMNEEGNALAEAVGHAVEHALQVGIQVEEISSERLLDQARLLERLDAVGLLRGEVVPEVTSELGLSRVAVLDARLRTVLEVSPGGREPPDVAAQSTLSQLKPLIEGKTEEMVVTPREPAAAESGRFLAAVRRSRGGVILAALDAGDILAFEKQVGAENLMQAVADTGGILYAVLEDSGGREMARAFSPEGEKNRAGLEVERGVELAHGEVGRLRIGLSTAALAAASRASSRRAAVTAALVFGLTLSLAVVTIATRRALALRGEAARTRSITGAVLEGMTDAVVVTDSAGIIRLANHAAERLFRVPPGGLVGCRCADSPCATIVGKARRGGPPVEMELQRPEGGPAQLLADLSPVTDESGEEVGSTLLVRDLTEAKRLERTARRSESLAAFGRLAAAVAHEVRNPLNAIAVGVQRLEREFPPRGPGEEHARLTKLLRSEIDRLNGTVTRFLELARPPRLDTRPGDIAPLVRDMARLLADGAPGGVRVIFEEGPLPPALYDEAAVRQVVLNLVRNALEALGEKGTVRVSIRREGSWAALAVADDGPGIAAENLGRVFDFGFTTRPDGNGLGLSIVHRLVTDMGGEVSIESEPGRGATVQVRLPLAAETA